MSWICDICSSANEDSMTECFVCGQARSVESIRLERRERRGRAIKNVFKDIDKVSNIILKTMFILTTILCSILTSILIIQKAKNGELGDIVECLIALGNNGGSSVNRLFFQIANVFGHYFGGNVLSVLDNIPVVFTELGKQFIVKWESYSEVIFKPSGDNIAGLFKNLSFCMGILWGNVVALWTILKLLFKHIVNNGKKIGSNVSSLIGFFKSKFN